MPSLALGFGRSLDDASVPTSWLQLRLACGIDRSLVFRSLLRL